MSRRTVPPGASDDPREARSAPEEMARAEESGGEGEAGRGVGSSGEDGQGDIEEEGETRGAGGAPMPEEKRARAAVRAAVDAALASMSDWLGQIDGEDESPNEVRGKEASVGQKY